MSNPQMLTKVLDTIPGEVDARDKATGDTGLMMAVRKGREDLVAVFVAKKADVNARCGDEEDLPLLAAAGRGSLDMATLLLDHGAQVDGQDKHGVSALMVSRWSYLPDVPIIMPVCQSLHLRCLNLSLHITCFAVVST
jgi:ankyrin repeat protein